MKIYKYHQEKCPLCESQSKVERLEALTDKITIQKQTIPMGHFCSVKGSKGVSTYNLMGWVVDLIKWVNEDKPLNEFVGWEAN